MKVKDSITSIRLVREFERAKITSVSRSKALQLESTGDFPRRRKLYPTGNAVGWFEHELIEWVLSREIVMTGQSHATR